MNERELYDGYARRAAQQCTWCTWCALVALLSPPEVMASDLPALEPQSNTLVVRAERASQSDDRMLFSLLGALELRADRWVINADSAILVGRLSDPDEIIVDGSPATITVQMTDESEPFTGTSSHLEFDTRKEIVRLEGDATVKREHESISSDLIRYWLQRETFVAGSRARVRVVTTPKNSR